MGVNASYKRKTFSSLAFTKFKVLGTSRRDLSALRGLDSKIFEGTDWYLVRSTSIVAQWMPTWLSLNTGSNDSIEYYGFTCWQRIV